MKLFSFAFLIISVLVFSCSESKKDKLKIKTNQPKITTPQNEVSVECPEINFPKLITLNSKELRIAKNSIFAKHGKKFKSHDLKKYFMDQPWYKENDDFTTDLLSESDKCVIELITHLEKNKNILWKSISNIDGKDDNELCLIVEKSEHSSAFIYINDTKIELLNNWFRETMTFPGQSLSSNWSNLSIKIIDINKLDNCKELVISQNYHEWEDPGFENMIITKHDGKVKSYKLGSNSYNAGKLTLSENKLILNVSNCPAHTQAYKILKGVLKMDSEFIEEEPEGGCPACFIGNSMVTIEGGVRKEISKLRAGDKVISYDTKTGVKNETIIEEIVSVQHSSFIELIFEHDTITSTKDHPYYLKGKGWCSFNTTATETNYSNYKSVKVILPGDDFIRSDGSTTKLLGINPIKKVQITYTITKLKDGDAFYVNDILVGVEKIRSPL
jgi:hypothetical protein